MSLEQQLGIMRPAAIHGEAVAGRSATVKKQIEKLKLSMGEHRWELADLLSEAHANHYNNDWGFPNFDDYIDNSNFDMSAREARYHIKINNTSKELGIGRDKLNPVAISKLKEIFRLDARQHRA
jgi:hypothetical protein